MIVRIVKLIIEPAKLSEFLETYSEANKKISGFKGCTYLELLTESDKTGVVFTYSHWDSEADLKNYLDSEFFKNTWSTVKPLFGGKPEAWSLKKY